MVEVPDTRCSDAGDQEAFFFWRADFVLRGTSAGRLAVPVGQVGLTAPMRPAPAVPVPDRRPRNGNEGGT